MTQTRPLQVRSEVVPDEARRLRAALLRHYDAKKRSLPWRGEPDPYRVWVSEIMLQQTRVETVIPYYERWVERFPSLEALAGAEVDDVMLAWQGLGYYRRARNLHRAAQVLRERAGGEVPTSYKELRALPGVGEYTAGAIASIAFGEAVPAVDGNVRRVLSRLFDVAEPAPSSTRILARALMDEERPGDFNQALMDLGATICSPRKPACGHCPVESWCAARAAGTAEERPARPDRRAVPKHTFVSVVVVDRDARVLVHRRPDDGLLALMWAFPSSPLSDDAADPVPSAREVVAGTGASLELQAPRLLEPVRHRFTHMDVTYRPVLFRGSGEAGPDQRWIGLGETDQIALPVAEQRIASAAMEVLAAT